MLIQSVQFLRTSITKWQPSLSEDLKTSNNPFAADYQGLLASAKDYLKSYIEQEVQKVINDKQMLVFTNNIDRPFVRECEQQEVQLEQLIKTLTCTIGKPLTEYEKAFITYTFYNDIEEMILKRVWQLNFFNSKKLTIILKAGQEILYTDLQELYAAYDTKKIWQYHSEG